MKIARLDGRVARQVFQNVTKALRRRRRDIDLLHIDMLLPGPLSYLSEGDRFHIVDSTEAPGGLSTITLESQGTRLQLVQERDELSLRMQPCVDGDGWFWIGVFRRAIDGDRKCGDQLDDRAINFLAQNVDGIDQAFRDANQRRDLVTLLATTAAQRADELFGPLPS